jgi:hypothetical protein
VSAILDAITALAQLALKALGMTTDATAKNKNDEQKAQDAVKNRTVPPKE